MKRILILLLVVTFINCFSQEYSKKWKDVDYVGDTLTGHMLDIYLPKVEKEKYPVVISIYGSAWFANNMKEADLKTIGKFLLDAGFALVTPNHRNNMEAKFPAQVHDIKAAIRFIRANAVKYKIDTSFVGITGSSSGGNLASFMGTSRNVTSKILGSQTIDVEGELGNFTEASSRVDAVVDWFGPTNMLVMDSCGTTAFIHNDVKSPASLYIGGAIQENKEKTLLASPTTYIDPSDPPFLIFHGDKDNLVPICQSEMLYNELQKAGVQSEYYVVPDGQHGPGVHIDKNLKMMCEFFKNELDKKAGGSK